MTGLLGDLWVFKVDLGWSWISGNSKIGKALDGSPSPRKLSHIWIDEKGDLLLFGGIADDGGFRLITVSRNENTVSWTFNDGSESKWEFDKNEYDSELLRLENEISKLSVTLEPQHVLFPE